MADRNVCPTDTITYNRCMERERKFLVEQVPPKLSQYPHSDIRQGYITSGKDDATVRVRIKNGHYILTVKTGRGTARGEVEVNLNPSDGQRLWRLTARRRLEKTRYEIPLGQHTIELDIFKGRLKGLVFAEVEFSSNAALRRFKPPEWFGDDVSEREGYSNSELARYGKPK